MFIDVVLFISGPSVGLQLNLFKCHSIFPVMFFFFVIFFVGLWIRALGCSLLISMASLICLILLPVIFGESFFVICTCPCNFLSPGLHN